MPLFGGFGAPAWSRMWSYFERRYGDIARDERVLPLPTATNAAWDDRIKILRLMEMYHWGDWQPSSAWQYAPNPGRRISEGFQYFLNAAFVAAVDANGTASEEVKRALRRASEEVQFTRAEYIAKQKEADQAYEDYAKETPRPHRMSKANFYADPDKGGYGWGHEIRTKRDRLGLALTTLEAVSKRLTDPDIELLKELKLNSTTQSKRFCCRPYVKYLTIEIGGRNITCFS